MAIIDEYILSRTFTLGSQAARELVYTILDAADETEAQAAVVGEISGAYMGLALESITCEPQGGDVWRATARYVREDGPEYSFSTGGGNSRITQSLETIASYAPGGFTAPDFQGAIGVSDDRVDGCDIPSRSYQFTETHRLDDSLITSTYKGYLFQLTGRYNNATFKGFAAGECLLLGVDGGKRGDEKWSLTFRFAASPNLEDVVIGDITVAEKLGWHYMWVRYGEYEDSIAYALVKRPIAAYVERVVEPGDFSLLGIGV